MGGPLCYSLYGQIVDYHHAITSSMCSTSNWMPSIFPYLGVQKLIWIQEGPSPLIPHIWHKNIHLKWLFCYHNTNRIMYELNNISCKSALDPGILQLHWMWSSKGHTILESVNVLLPLIRRFSSTFGSSWWTNMTLGDTCFPFPGLTECLFFSFSVFSSALLLDKTSVLVHTIIILSCASLQYRPH